MDIPNKRWWQFSLRTLLAITTGAACLFGIIGWLGSTGLFVAGSLLLVTLGLLLIGFGRGASRGYKRRWWAFVLGVGILLPSTYFLYVIQGWYRESARTWRTRTTLEMPL